MKDADKAIEQLLQGLRDAEPAPGFEQGIFTALRRAEETQSAAAVPRRLLLLHPLAWPARPAWALACLLLVVLALTVGVASFVTGYEPRQQKLSRNNAQKTAVVRPSPAPMLVAPQPPGGSRHAMSSAPRRGSAAKSAAAKSHAPTEQSAWSNSPAPPLPLTAQEKLLRRIARRRDAGNLDLLIDYARNAQTARAAQQFQRFFAIDPEEMRTQLE